MVRFDGSDQQPLNIQLNGDLRFPSWSPDGTAIAFVQHELVDETANDVVTVDHIWVFNITTGELRHRMTCDALCNGIAWSPDGKTLAYLDIQPRWRALYAYEFATGKRRPVVRPDDNGNGGSGSFAWSPDSKFLMFSHMDQNTAYKWFWVVESNGSNKRPTNVFHFGEPVDWFA
jgi:Tol biopolymer transport system component